MLTRTTTVIFGVSTLLACEQSANVSSNLELHALTEVRTIGTLDGSDAEMFGEIEDVELGGDGSILVLDRQAVAIARYSAGGDFIGSYHSQGQGPGEMLRPQDIEVVGDTVLVLDSSNNRIHLLHLAPSGLSYEGHIPLPMRAWSMCEMGGRIYLHYHQGSYLLHEANRTGDVLRSFAPVLEIPENLAGTSLAYVQIQRMRGPIYCVDGSGVIVAIGGVSPHVRGFTADGDLLWDAEVADYRPSIFRMVSGGFPDWEIPENGAHVAIGLVRWNEAAVLLQLEVRSPTEVAREENDPVVESRLLSLDDGRELARSDAVPRLSGGGGDLLVGWENEPFPRVQIYHRQ